MDRSFKRTLILNQLQLKIYSICGFRICGCNTLKFPYPQQNRFLTTINHLECSTISCQGVTHALIQILSIYQWLLNSSICNTLETGNLMYKSCISDKRIIIILEWLKLLNAKWTITVNASIHSRYLNKKLFNWLGFCIFVKNKAKLPNFKLFIETNLQLL